MRVAENTSAPRTKEMAANPLQKDDVVTICAISVIAFGIADMLHEGVGHAAIALLTGSTSGVLSTVAWSSPFDSRLVAAGGTLVNIAAAILFWLALRGAKTTSVNTRFFLLICSAFNLFDGTGYFFFSGVTNFGDWAVVIDGLNPHWLWRTGLVVAGMAAYIVAVRIVGSALVRNVGISLSDSTRLTRMTIFPYMSAVALATAAGLMNPLGLALVLESALPSTAGANCGLLWMKYYVPKRVIPEVRSEAIVRSYAWIGSAAAITLVFIFVLGRGITLTR